MYIYIEIEDYIVDTIGSGTLVNWESSKSYCSSLGTTLASIHSDSDQYKARLNCKSIQLRCWIGLNDINNEGTYIWDDGSSSDYGFNNNDPSNPTKGIFPWSNAWMQPDNSWDNEHCVELWLDFDFEWNDGYCLLEQATLCNQIPNPIEECLINEYHSIYAWYDGTSIDIKYNLWRDKSGNNNNGIINISTGIQLFDGTNTSNS